MFVSVEDIKFTTGVDVTYETVRVAQLMIETYVGRSEIEVDDAADQATLGRATMLQAIYMNESADSLLEQPAVKQVVTGDASSTFDTSKDAPFMAPLAVMACKKLSWFGSRTIHTGPMVDRARWVGWERL